MLLNVDFEDIFNLLDKGERKMFIDNNYSNDLFTDLEIAKKTANIVDIYTAIDAFSREEIMDWLESNADTYGYVKEEE